MVEAGKKTNNVKLGQGPEKIKRFKSWGADRDKDWKKARETGKGSEILNTYV